MISNSTAATYLYGTNDYVRRDQYVIGSLTIDTSTAVVKRGPFRQTLSLEIDSVDVTIVNGAITYGGKALAVAASDGDLALVSFEVVTILNTSISVPRWTGIVTQVEPRATETRIVAKSRIAYLQNPKAPGRIMQTKCPYVFKGADGNCGASSGTTCNKVLSGGCTTNANTGRFGGFVNVVSVTVAAG